jgi:hypothetical protein
VKEKKGEVYEDEQRPTGGEIDYPGIRRQARIGHQVLEGVAAVARVRREARVNFMLKGPEREHGGACREG